MATITEPMALDKSFNTTETTSRSQADVLAGIEQAILQGMGRQANEVSYDNTTSGLSAGDVQEAVDELASEKVDKVTGKGLSTNDYTTDEKNKLAGIEAGAQVNVQSDWAQSDDEEDDFIKNKQLVTEPIEELQNDVKSTQTATGNPITLTDAAPINAEKLEVVMEPKQDLHGQSAPYVGGAGVNQWDEEWEVGTINASTGETQSNTTRMRSKNYIPIEPNTTYKYVQGTSSGAISTGRVCFYDENKNFIEGNATFPGGGDTFISPLSFTTPSNAYYMKFSPATQYGANYISNISINYPSTITTYAPYSNICPITGYTECEVDDVGKNLLPLKFYKGLSYNTSVGNTFDLEEYSDGSQSGNSVSFNITAWGKRCMLSNKLKAGNYKLSMSVTSTASDLNYTEFVLDADYKVLRKGSIQNFGTSRNVNSSFTISEGDCYIAIELGCNASATITYTEPQIEQGSTATTYEPYHSSNATIQFGQTVYGGRSNFTEGGTDDEYSRIDLGSLAWSYRGTTTNGLFSADLPGYAFKSDIDALCEGYKYIGTVPTVTDMRGKNNGDTALFYSSGSESRVVYVIDTDYSDATEFKTAVTGIYLLFEKATPTTIQTPSTELKLLKGTNNLSTNGTTITLGYQPDNVIGEVKGEIEKHLEMPWVKVIIDGEQNDFDEILLEDGGNIIQFPLADNEIYKHRFLHFEVYTTLLGLPMSLCGNAMLSTQTLIEFEHGAYIPLSIGNLTDGITARVYVSITSDSEIQIQLESTASSPLTNIYIRARLVD